jgi:hypothetical protein
MDEAKNVSNASVKSVRPSYDTTILVGCAMFAMLATLMIHLAFGGTDSAAGDVFVLAAMP